jgi:hypothetical protein
MSRHSAAGWDSNQSTVETRPDGPLVTTRKLWWLAASLAVLGLVTPASMLAQTNATPQILFLHLRVTNQTVSLVGFATQPGVLKRARDAAADELHYEMVSATSESLWKAAVADPTIRHLEYEEPPGSGNLKRKTIVLAGTEFTIRVPVLPKARRIDFYRLEPSAPGAIGERALTRKSLGSVVLP